jgi:hypothetical protein
MYIYTVVLYLRISRPEDGGCMSLRNHKCPLYVLSTLNDITALSLSDQPVSSNTDAQTSRVPS